MCAVPGGEQRAPQGAHRGVEFLLGRGGSLRQQHVRLVARRNDVQVRVRNVEACDDEPDARTPKAAFWAMPIVRATVIRWAATSEGASVHAS